MYRKKWVLRIIDSNSMRLCGRFGSDTLPTVGPTPLHFVLLQELDEGERS